MLSLDTIMSTNLITVPLTATLADARALMHENRIHHLPVTGANGELVGLLTQTNVLAATDSFLRKADQLEDEEIPISEVMVRDVKTIDERASVREAALYLEKMSIGCLPVLRDGKLVGIITDTDFVAIAINLLEQMEEFEPLDDEYY